MSSINIPVLDLAIIVIYMLGILAVGIWVARRDKMTSDEYFLAGRSLSWPIIGSALFASNISTIHLVGLASAGFEDGIVQGNFEWLAAPLLVVLGLIFAPFYFRNKIETLPEFLEKRYNGTARTLLALMGILAALFIHIGISLYAGAVVFENFFGINIWISIGIISVVTGIYTVLGGLKSVVVTETIQTVVLITGSVILMVLAVTALPEHGIHSYADLKAAVKPGQLDLLRTAESSPKLPWYAILLGYPVIGIWYWCSDQTIVQRVLGAKTIEDARRGPVFAGFIKILPVFIMVVPGILAYVLFGDIISDPNDALPTLITQLLPTGLMGILSAALLAALMSTIAAALNSSATLVSVDIMKRLRPEITDKQQVRIGRWTAALVMVLAIAWSPIVKHFISIFDAINEILSVLAPPIATVFLFGVFWKRGTEEAAVTTIISGFVLAMLVFLIDFPVYGDVKIITEYLNIPYMLQAWWLFVITSIIFVVVSYATPEPRPDQIENLTLDSPLAFMEGEIEGFLDPRIWAGILMVVMIGLYILFN